MLKEIIEKCCRMELFEKRTVTEDYCELVFHNKDMGELGNILTAILGPAVKPPKAKPSKEDLLVTKNYGSIKDNQTLFRKDCEGGVVMAMLWPWGDGAHTTLKSAFIKK